MRENVLWENLDRDTKDRTIILGTHGPLPNLHAVHKVTIIIAGPVKGSRFIFETLEQMVEDDKIICLELQGASKFLSLKNHVQFYINQEISDKSFQRSTFVTINNLIPCSNNLQLTMNSNVMEDLFSRNDVQPFYHVKSLVLIR